MLRLDCSVQSYAWGKNGSESAVARFKSSSDSTFKISEDKSYAELWMGTHPSGPSKILGTALLLKEWLNSNPDAVGTVPPGYDSSDLPFLFKVLSIKTALSIQAHPDKLLAKELNEKFPDIYKDSNHKPEMAIALTPFEALCGFRRPFEILEYLEEYPELAHVIGSQVVTTFQTNCKSSLEDAVRGAYKTLFYGFMSATDDIVNTEITKLINRITSLSSKTVLQNVILRLNIDYPNDRGIFCPLLLNYLTLHPGDCFFMGPNEPHAYLSGDCVECMALSDNVVRAGLTPKLKDVDTLCHMLHYRNGEPALLSPIIIDHHVSLYRPPAQSFPEFEVEKIVLSPMEVYQLTAIPTASILLTIEAGSNGEATIYMDNDLSQPFHELSVGSVLFVSANSSASLNSGRHPLIVYRAHINLGN